jgi:phospholipid transport system transporter-binding protein
MGAITQQEDRWNLSGVILMDNANAVLEESAALEMDDRLVVDFSAVTDIDTAALSLMMAWMRRAKADFCKITFAHLPEGLVSLATLYGVHEFITFE